MTHDTMTDAEMDAILNELEGAGLVETFADDEGRPSMRLTEQGVQIARQMALSGDEDAQVLLDALLDGARQTKRPAPRGTDLLGKANQQARPRVLTYGVPTPTPMAASASRRRRPRLHHCHHHGQVAAHRLEQTRASR
jgi:hypothetical protein